MGWALWLSIPVVVTALAAMWSWIRSRPAPPPTTHQAMRDHSEYLDALAQTARSKDRGLPLVPEPAPEPVLGAASGPSEDTTDPHLHTDS